MRELHPANAVRRATGDVVTPGPSVIDFPVLLDAPAPHVRAYTRESVIAEKLHAMVTRGIGNSRMKDF